MPDYSNWDELCNAAQKKCHDILGKDVAPVVKEIVRKHIKEDIYDAYTPIPNKWINGTTYHRRHILENSIYHEFIHDDEIMVTSKATASKSVVPGYSFHNRRPGAFLLMLETGDMGFWRKGFPRPAIKMAQEEINEDRRSVIKNAIQSGLDRYF